MVFGANTVLTEVLLLLSNYYPDDAPEEAIQMCLSYSNENEMSVNTFEKILRRMGGQLIMCIIDEQRIKHPEILDKFHNFRDRKSLYKGFVNY